MGEIAMIVTFFFACIGILLMQVAVKRESFDFWLGCAGAGVIYLVTDWLNEVLPVTYYTGFKENSKESTGFNRGRNCV